MANSVDPDHTAPLGAIILFAQEQSDLGLHRLALGSYGYAKNEKRNIRSEQKITSWLMFVDVK